MSLRLLACGIATSLLVACGQVTNQADDDTGDDDAGTPATHALIIDPATRFVRTGGEVAIDFTIERTGEPQPVTVTLEPFVAGVLAEPVTLDAATGTGQIIVAVAANTAIVHGTLAFTATAGDRTDHATVGIDLLGAAGSPDRTFGSSGVATMDLSGTNTNETIAFAIDQGDKVVIGVAIKRNGLDGIRVVRRALDGTADPSFGTAGEVFLDLSTIGLVGTQAGGVAQADGKIVIAGSGSNGADQDPFIARLTADGQIDGALALRRLDATAANLGFATLAVGPAGEIVVGGNKSLTDTSDAFMIRLDAAGVRDAGFGSNGLATFHDLNLTQLQNLTIQADGRIVALIGTLSSNTGFEPLQYALRRFGSDGRLDTTFGTSGKATLPTPEGLVFANTLMSPDRLNLLVGGSARGVLFGGSDAAVWRFLSDGRLDLGFGGGIGYYVAPATTIADSISHLAVAEDGSIYGVGGESENFALTSTLLLHLDATGAPATDFPGGLIRHAAAGLFTRAMYLRADHRLMLATQPFIPAEQNDTVLEAFFR